MFLKIIACEVAFREICWVAAQSPHLVEVEFLTQGYHNNSVIGRERLQQHLDAAPEGKHDAILLGYALCNNMAVGLQARHTPLVIPRAHDCITFLLGSKERYAQIFRERPGTYYYSSGWLEYRARGGERLPLMQGAEMGPECNCAEMGPECNYEDLAAKYGEEAARYVLETLGQWICHYTHGVLISFDFTDHLPFVAQVKRICADHGWQYDELRGDIGLLRRWVNGDWGDDDFLVVQPGERIVATHDQRVLGAEPAGAAPVAAGGCSA